MLLKPTAYMSQALKARMGMPAARKPVTLALEAHEEDFAAHVFQGGEQLLRLFDVTAQVAFTVDDQQRGGNVLHIGYGRHALVTRGVFVGRTLQVIDGEFPADVAAAKEG